MARITEQLIRKRSEHNECIIATLEELSLHQEDIEKIEHINNWCKELQILYLQANLISKIENLNKLKKLQYLNLAINNIERIENLERCESLEKLDLTLNFIGDLESIENLKHNSNLKHLYLTGNPCCEFEGYRDYIIRELPQLKTLDSIEISKSERIRAFQNVDKGKTSIKQLQASYKISREQQIERGRNLDVSKLTDEEFWKSTSENSPEARLEIAKRSQKSKNSVNDSKKKQSKPSVAQFHKSGRPLNINQAKINFKFDDENPEKFLLEVDVYKYLDTNLIDIDLQPIYVRITIKGKVFQLVFPEEILIDKSTAKRSATTGHLHLDLPKANYHPVMRPKKEMKAQVIENARTKFLEIPSSQTSPEVPPLEYA